MDALAIASNRGVAAIVALALEPLTNCDFLPPQIRHVPIIIGRPFEDVAWVSFAVSVFLRQWRQYISGIYRDGN